MTKKLTIFLVSLIILTLACVSGTPTPTPGPIPTLSHDPFQSGQTVYGFFPSPPDISNQSLIDLYKHLGKHSDVVLLQKEVPWKDFVSGVDGPSPIMADLTNQVRLARENGLEAIFIVDALNGLDRTKFYNLPPDWKASFGDKNVRSAFTNYALRILRDFHPRYLGLGSEVNTYADTHPDDFPNYLSLYQEVYTAIKAESPDTEVFVTFQWEELNNLIPIPGSSRQRLQTNWEQIEAFEPRLDVWAISSYPFVAFKHAADVPTDYYARLLERTGKPLAVAEGGFPSRGSGSIPGSPQDQVDYLNAIHSQIGTRLSFWIYLLFQDLNIVPYAAMMTLQGHAGNIGTLNMFTSVGINATDGKPKPALKLWDSFR